MLLSAALVSGCDRGREQRVDGIVQTKYPGQVTAGGATSGTILAQTARPTTDAVYAGGTPGIAGGSGGNTAGAEVGGSTRETGQGPARGVSNPTGVQPGTQGQMPDYGKPARPAPGEAEAPSATNVAPNPPAAGKDLGKQ
ncbi:hypothetical protein IM543_15655 [Massilia sp. UMI-21]|nr:hypothetical protein IM543_15655 [Massilia sp. UMI-21]